MYPNVHRKVYISGEVASAMQRCRQDGCTPVLALHLVGVDVVGLFFFLDPRNHKLGNCCVLAESVVQSAALLLCLGGPSTPCVLFTSNCKSGCSSSLAQPLDQHICLAWKSAMIVIERNTEAGRDTLLVAPTRCPNLELRWICAGHDHGRPSPIQEQQQR